MDEIEDELTRAMNLNPRGGVSSAGTDQRIAPSIAVLVKAVRRLDATSSRLAGVNIALTVVILLVGIVQVVLMLRGH